MKGNHKLFGFRLKTPLPKGISKIQRKRIENGYRKIKDHLSEKDIIGAIGDIKGNPILNKDGIPYQHFKEVEDAVRGLRKERDSLVKWISNPFLSKEIEKAIRDAINDFDIIINRWDRIKGGKQNG